MRTNVTSTLGNDKRDRCAEEQTCALKIAKIHFCSISYSWGGGSIQFTVRNCKPQYLGTAALEVIWMVDVPVKLNVNRHFFQL